MCLLVQQPATVSFTDAFLSDVYGKNRDGLGIMYAEAGKLHVYKCLPANADDFIAFYREHGDRRACIWHARMRTHGDVDKDNCHPYHVIDDIWLSHNGVLSTGNSDDETKSDTWHFIKHVLRPALAHNPDLMLDKSWLSFIGDLIGGGNKFGLMRSDGKSAIINRRSGVEFMQSWVSNTYAWTPSKFGMTQPKTQTAWTGHNGRLFQEYESSYSNWQRQQPSGVQTGRSGGSTLLLELDEDEASRPTEGQVRRFTRAAYNQWTRRGIAGVEQWVYDAPEKAAAVLAFWYEDLNQTDLLDLVNGDPDEAAEWIEDLFRTDSVTPSWLA